MSNKAVHLPTVTEYGSSLTEPGAEGEEASFGYAIMAISFLNRRWREANAREGPAPNVLIALVILGRC